MRRGERPIWNLPPGLLAGFVLTLIAQLAFHHLDRDSIEARYRPLASPLETSAYRALAMGSERLLAHLLSIRLQLHDNQAGQHFQYSLIDYDLLIEWLERLSDLDAENEYPMLLASRIYSMTGDAEKLRAILGFIERRFDHDPQLHWRRLAEASLLAKHRLKDLEFALRLAEKLALQPEKVRMPHWARDFRFLLLAEMNEYESAIAIIQALLGTESIQDPDERKFLREKLLDFQQSLSRIQQQG